MTGQMVVPYGNVLARYVMKVTLNPVPVVKQIASEQTFAVAGLEVGSAVRLVYQGPWIVPVIQLTEWVSAANTLAVSYYNPTWGNVTPPTGTYYLEIEPLDMSNIAPPSFPA